MSHLSAPELLVLHALRVKGMADAATVTERFDLDRELVDELLLDHEAFGWISRVRFADIEGWALTTRGRVEDERRLATELDQTGTRSDVVAAHDAFVVLNSRFLAAITNWQIRPELADPLAANDHSDRRWDERVLNDLAILALRCSQFRSGSGQRCTGSLDTASGTPRLWTKLLMANEPGSPNRLSTPAIRFGWNSTRTC